MKNLILLATIAAMIAISCNKSDNIMPENKVDAKFHNGLITRAVDNSWSAGDKIGIYMIKTGEQLSDATIAEGAKNIEYNADAAGESGTFTANSTKETIYYPLDNSGVDFYAYYPYTSAANNTHLVEIKVTDQTNQEAIDLMTADKIVNKTKSSPNVALNFKHRFAKLTFKMECGAGITDEDLANLTVKIQGMQTVATYSLATDEILSSPTNEDITMKTTTNGKSTEAIIIPTLATANSKIAFTFAKSNKTLYWDISEISFEEGTKYEYTITVNSREISLDDAKINKWITGNGELGENLEANPPIPLYIEVRGLKVASGNLIADGKGGCKIGKPTDGGLYFRFGSLIGWSGSGNNNGTGRDSGNDITVVVKPENCTPGPISWEITNDEDANILSNYYFSYIAEPYATDGTNIRDFDISIKGAGAEGTLGSGRYAALGVGDPCSYYLQGSWRLPTTYEIQTLIIKDEYESNNHWCPVGNFNINSTDSYALHKVSRLTFPAAGMISDSRIGIGELGSYSTSTVYYEDFHFSLYFGVIAADNPNLCVPNNFAYRTNGQTIRCILDEPQ